MPRKDAFDSLHLRSTKEKGFRVYGVSGSSVIGGVNSLGQRHKEAPNAQKQRAKLRELLLKIAKSAPVG